MFWRKKKPQPQPPSQPSRSSKPASNDPTAAPPKLSLLSLESRLMFDAAAAATAAEVNQEQVAQAQAESAVSAEGNGGEPTVAETESQDLLQAIASYTPGESTTEVAFVDPTVPDYQSLIAGMGPNVQIVILDGGQDGMEQIAASLAGRTGIDAIHIISHGTEGQLSLGTGTLTHASMTDQYADELATIRQSLSESADILVYGCDFAEGQVGQDTATLLSQLTGADVAASTDATGYAEFGGDWVLETQTGSIETTVVVTDEVQANWKGLLAETWMDAATGAVIGGPVGNDWYVGDSANNAPVSSAGGADIMYGAGGDDTLTSGSGNDILVGGTGNDTISGGSDDDVILGGTGNDYLDGGSAVGKNTIIGGGGSDQMVGGSGADVFRFTGAQSGDAYTVDGGGATDIIDLSEFSTATITNSGGVITVDRGGGNVFTITHSNVESIITAATVGNHGPLADASSDQTVAMSATVTLTAAGSSDQDGNPLTYKWTQIEGPKVTLSSSTAVSPTFTAPSSATTLQFIVVVSDGTTSHADTVTITVGDGPTNVVPSSQTTAEDTSLVFSSANGNQISITDPNGSSGTFEVTLSVTSGTITLAGTTGLTFVTGDGTADTMMTVRGTVTNINNALNGSSFAPTSNYNGGATLSVTTIDSTLVSLNLDANLQARYTFEGNANDVASGTAQNGTLNGNATYVTDTTRGQVLSLDGVNDNVQITGLFSNPTNVTLAAWVNLTSADTSGAEVISLGDNVVLRLDDPTNKLVAWVYTGGGSFTSFSYNTTLAGTGWHHVAFSFSDTTNTATLYLDGVAVNSTSTAVSINYTAGGTNTFIGKHGNGSTSYDFNGKIDDARIYNRALSASEISALASDLSLTDTDTVAITVTAVNDGPAFTSLNGTPTFTEGGSAVVLDSTVTITDTELTAANNFNGATLTLSRNGGANSQDVFSGSGTLSLSGGNVVVGGTTIGTYTNSGGTLVMTFNSNATNTLVNSAMQQIAYSNSSDAPPSSVQVNWTFNDGNSSSQGSGGSLTATGSVTVSITAVNDAPVLADTALSITVAEDAGAPSGAVGSLISAFTSGITEPDGGSTKGIAITGSNETNGTWYYTTNGGTTWTAVGTVSAASSLLLADNGSTRLYFAPSANYTGTSSAALTVRAWDQTSGTAGTKVSTASTGGTTAFSSATDTVDVSVTAVNDAPVLTPTNPVFNTSEGAASVAAYVSDLLLTNLTDADSGAVEGIAIFGISGSGATMEYSLNGTTWLSLGSVSATNALLLRATDQIRIIPDADNGGTLYVDYRGWDQTAGTAGTKVNASVTGGTTAFSSASDQAVANITAVNDAPVLADTALSITVAEDAGAPSGAVGSLISAFTSGITEPDGGSTKGIAITGSNETNGTWYYTTNGGTTWTAVGTVSAASSLLLADNGSTRLYFAPSANYTGTSSAALTVRAWDQTSGTAGTKVSTASTGGTTAFSSATDTVDVSVTAVNDAPVITGLAGDSLAYSEGSGVQWIEQGLDVAVTDSDSADFSGGTLTVSFVSGSDSAEDVLAVFNQGSAAGQIGVSGSNITYGGVTIGTFTGGSGGANLVITFNSNATPARVSTLVNLITYQNTDTDAPTTGTRTVRYVLTDGDGGTSLNYDTTVTVSAVNDTPTDLSLSANTVAENASNGTVIGMVSGIDPDNGDTQTYSFTDSAGGRFAINSSTGQITVANSSLLNYESATSHSVTVRVTDAGGLTYDETFTINLTNVNETPTDLSLSANTVAENAANGTVVGTVSGTDPDSGDTKTYSLTDTAGGRFAINSSTGQITVANSSLLDYENATNHSVTVRVTDAGGLTYDETFTINLTNVNEAPTGADATVMINEDTSHTLTTANFGFSDVDAGDSLSAVRIDTIPTAGSLTLSGIAVTAGQIVTVADITAGNLVFTPASDANGTGYANCTFSVRDSNNAYDAAPNTLTFDVTAVNDAPTRTAGTVSNLTVSEDAGLVSLGLGSVSYSPGGGADESGQTLTYAVTVIPSASVGDVFLADGTTRVTVGSYTLADIQGMQFRPAANASGVTAFQFNVSDSGGTANGGANSISQFILITVNAVNDTPTITSLSGDSLSYTEGAGAVVIEQGGNALVADVDSTNLDTGTLTVSIPSGGDSAEDVLSIRNQGTGAGQIGVSGSNVTYEGVTIGTFTGGSGGTSLVITLNASASPTAVTALVQHITYENTDTAAPTTGARTVRYVLTDGDGGTSANYDTTVTVSGVNDAPVVTPVAPDVTFVEGGLAQLIDATGTITDVDSANLDGGVLTVSLSANGTADDRLIVGNWGTGPGQVGVSGSNVTYEGTLIGTVSGGTSGSDPLLITFNANATAAAAQEVYRSIQFNNVSDNPSTATRTLTIGLTDGDGGTATPQNKLVYVQGTNDAPVLTFGEGDKNFTEGALAVMIDTLPTISDLDSTNFDTGTLTITISANPSVDDRVELLNTGMGAGQIGVSGTNVYYGGTLIGTQGGGIGAAPFVVTFNANADASVVGAVMANIRFWVAGDTPSTATRTVDAVLTDGDGGTSLTASKQITVTAVNDPTTITGGTSGSGTEDTTLTGTLTATDSDGLSDGTVFTVSANATNGTASIDPATGLWSYSPNADWNGSDSFTVTITDDAGNSSTQVISVTVTPVVDLTNDSLTTAEDTAISANVLTGTNGATADSFEGTPVLTSVTQGANGSVTFLANGTVTYTPTANYTGTDSFTYTITSGGVTETATVTVTINAVNDPTVVTGGTTGSGNEDTTISNTLTATDAEGLSDGTVFSVSGAATNGTASIDPATGLWSYTPNADWNGTDSFTVTITDDAGNPATQVISVTVTPVVDLTNDSLTTNEDTAISANVLTGTNGATADSFEGTPVLTSVTQGANGSVTFLANGTVTYMPNANFNGLDSFTYTITSGGVTETATVTVTVTAVNDATVVTGGTSGSGPEDSTLTGTLTATDVEGLSDGTVFSVSTAATNGTASIDPATGLWSYTPNPDWNGSDSFTVTITDDAGNSSTQVISVTVTPVNDAPVLSTNTGSTVAEGGSDTIGSSELAVTDVDNTAAQLTYIIGTGPAYGRLELTTAPGLSATIFTQADIAANRLVYVHDGSETTSDSFTFTVSDGAGGTVSTTTLTLTITPVNDTPTIMSGGAGPTAAINVAENVSAVTIVTGADVDLPAQALTYNISGGADQARFTINPATGAVNFTAPPDFEAATDANGDNVYVVQVQVTDSQGASTTQTIQVTVTDMAESVPLPPAPIVPPVLLSPTPPSPTGPGPLPSSPSRPAEPPTDALPQAPALPDSHSAPAESHPATVLPSPTERLVVIRPEEPRATIDEAKDSVLFPWIDEARRLLLAGLLGESTPTPESEPAEKSQSVSDLLFSKLDEMTASLEQAMGVSQEQHVMTVRIAALTGTTLSAGFIAWALRSGTLLASFMATMPAWRHFDPLPVLGGSRSDWERRKKEAEQDQQAENTEFKGLKHLLDLGIPPDPKP